MLDILNPAKRKALYGIFGAAAVVLVTLGFAPKVTVDNWVEVAVQVVGLLALILSSIKAKRADYTVLYGGAAGLVAALTAAGVFNDGVASQIYDVMAQIAIALPLLVAFVRTDTSTESGAPVAEVVAPVLGVVAAPAPGEDYDPRHDELGAVDNRMLWTVLIVVLIIAVIIWIVRAL